MIIHVSYKIHTFFLDSCDFGLEIALHRYLKSPSSLIEVVGGRRGSRVIRPRYLVCYFRGALRRHPRTMYCSELCRGSWTAILLKIR